MTTRRTDWVGAHELALYDACPRRYALSLRQGVDLSKPTSAKNAEDMAEGQRVHKAMEQDMVMGTKRTLRPRIPFAVAMALIAVGGAVLLWILF